MKKKLCNLLIVMIMATLFPLQVFAEDVCNHNWSDWIVYRESDCGTNGSEYRYCYLCNKEEEQKISATGKHNWDLWEQTKSATINATGLKERECWMCGATQTSIVPKLKPYIKLSKKTIKLAVSKTYKLKTSYAKGDSVKKYKSNNKKVATVTANGKIKAKKKGTAKITVLLKSGKKATCTVKVSAKKKSSSNKVGKTVYWVPSGEVYHSTKNCPTLSRSRTIYKGSKSSCPKSRPCKVCY